MNSIASYSAETTPKPHLTGTHINYYHVCTRKLWLFHYGVTMEHKSDLVALGRLTHEEHYARDISKDQLMLQGIRIDRITPGGVIHEVKKSNKLEDAHVWQLKYYLYVLKQQDIWPLSGKLEYPKLRKTLEVNLTSDDEQELANRCIEISKILESKTPPKVDKMRICRKCAYFEYCWS